MSRKSVGRLREIYIKNLVWGSRFSRKVANIENNEQIEQEDSQTNSIK